MKKKIAAAVGLVIAAFAIAAPPVGDVVLEWTPQTPATTNKIFKLYGSPTLSPPTWTVLTNISGLSTNCTIRIIPGQYYFTMTESNMWGESVFSNVAQTEPLPLSPQPVLRQVR